MYLNCDGARLIGNTVTSPKEWGLDIARHVSCPSGDPCSGSDNVYAEGSTVRNASFGRLLYLRVIALRSSIIFMTATLWVVRPAVTGLTQEMSGDR